MFREGKRSDLCLFKSVLIYSFRCVVCVYYRWKWYRECLVCIWVVALDWILHLICSICFAFLHCHKHDLTWKLYLTSATSCKKLHVHLYRRSVQLNSRMTDISLRQETVEANEHHSWRWNEMLPNQLYFLPARFVYSAVISFWTSKKSFFPFIFWRILLICFYLSKLVYRSCSSRKIEAELVRATLSSWVLAFSLLKEL